MRLAQEAFVTLEKLQVYAYIMHILACYNIGMEVGIIDFRTYCTFKTPVMHVNFTYFSYLTGNFWHDRRVGRL